MFIFDPPLVALLVVILSSAVGGKGSIAIFVAQHLNLLDVSGDLRVLAHVACEILADAFGEKTTRQWRKSLSD
jgi:hypothetical protein